MRSNASHGQTYPKYCIRHSSKTVTDKRGNIGIPLRAGPMKLWQENHQSVCGKIRRQNKFTAAIKNKAECRPTGRHGHPKMRQKKKQSKKTLSQ